MYMVHVYVLLFIIIIEWYLSMRLFDALHERARKMKKLTVLLTFCWVLLVSQILAISSLYNDGLQDIPGSPSVITLMEHQSSELNIESKLEENIEATLKNISYPLTDDLKATEEPVAQEVQDIPQQEKDALFADIRPTPTAEAKPTMDDKINDSGGDESLREETTVAPQREDTKNATAETPQSSDGNLTEENPMPVFSEWAQKQMAEAEKKHGENVNASAMKRNSKPAGGKMPPLKLRAKNYASPDCGAKIIASNPEAQSTGSVLTSHKDEYLLNPCTSKIWFVVELCEPIQAERVELANFELFSSSPKDFSISVSNRFPTREWSNVGFFTAQDERDVQSFKLHPHLFGKFVRVEVHSHYNSEHYCPVSLFHVYGTSEFEAFETDNTPLGDDGEDDDDEELVVTDHEQGKEHSIVGENHGQKIDGKEGGHKAKNPNNILKSAGEAVMSIVKKAAEALVKTNENNSLGNETTESAIGDGQDVVNETKLDLIIDSDKSSSIDVTLRQTSRCSLYCFSLAYRPLCVNCPEELQVRLERTMNCKHNLLTSLLRNVPISTSFNESQHLLCANILGNNLIERREQKDLNIRKSILGWLPDDFLAGLCNVRAYDDGLIDTTINMEGTFSEPSGEKRHSEIMTSTETTKKEHQSEANEKHPPRTTVKDDTITTSHPSSAAGEDDRSKPLVIPQEDINIFNVQEKASTPVSVDQIEETGPVSSSSSTDIVKENRDETEHVPEGGGSFEEIDQLLLEQPLDGVGGGGSPPVMSTTSTTSSPGTNQKVQPESVFLRLSNRIKSLERNMSLSGQYLEELSRRYRKQVEELQNSHSKTLHDIEEQNRRILESEAMLREENDRLRKEFVVFRENMLSWRNVIIILGGFLFGQLALVCAVVKGCKKSGREVETDDTLHKELEKVDSAKPLRGKLLRRKSIDGMIGEIQAPDKLKKKRPSEEALNISGTYVNLLIEDDRSGEDGVKAERKKTKHKHRKISAPAMMQQSAEDKFKRAVSVEPLAAAKMVKVDLVRTESAPEPKRQTSEVVPQDENNRIDELPLLEDNDEFIIPAASDLSYNEFIPHSMSENNRTNGTVSSSSSVDSKSTNRSGKGRRLSSPAFFKSSILRASMSRKSSGKKSTPSQNVSSASSNTSSSSGSNNVSSSINVHSTSVVGNHVEEGPPLASSENNSSTTSITNNGWDGWRILKKSSSQGKVNKRKAKSETPEVEIADRNGSVNGSALDHGLFDVIPKRSDHKGELKSSVSFNGSTTSSEKKLGGGGGSFRRLLRKVF